ncbi:MAG: recombinase family protein [Terracidiphilus sp.]
MSSIRIRQLSRVDRHGGTLGRALVVIIGAIAELERNLIIERVRAGMRRARVEGRHFDSRRTLPARPAKTQSGPASVS